MDTRKMNPELKVVLKYIGVVFLLLISMISWQFYRIHRFMEDPSRSELLTGSVAVKSKGPRSGPRYEFITGVERFVISCDVPGLYNHVSCSFLSPYFVGKKVDLLLVKAPMGFFDATVARPIKFIVDDVVVYDVGVDVVASESIDKLIIQLVAGVLAAIFFIIVAFQRYGYFSRWRGSRHSQYDRAGRQSRARR